MTMMMCRQDSLNRIWRLFASKGISDDIQIIEALAYRLLRYIDAEDLDAPDQYARSTPLSSNQDEQLDTLITELVENVSPADALNHCLLFHLDSMQAGGRYPTPRHITNLVSKLVQTFIDADEFSVADLACGSGGFLVEFPKNPITGVEISPTWARIARSNLRLHNMASDKVFTGDAIPVSFRTLGRYDAICLNPPFGSPMEEHWLRYSHSLEEVGTRSETVLAQLALNLLQPNGVLAVLQPSGALFSTSGGEHTLRQRLIAQFKLDAIIQLPKDAFQPYSQLQTYLLVARKTPQSSIERDAPVWFYHVTHDGYSSGRNRQPQPERSQFPLLVSSIAAEHTNKGWQTQDENDAVVLDIRPLEAGGYRIIQSSDGRLTVNTIVTETGNPLWITRQSDSSHQVLLHESALWRQRQLLPINNQPAWTSLTFQLSDENNQSLELFQDKDSWKLTLKSSQKVIPTTTLTSGKGYLALFVSLAGELLSPILQINDLKDYRPKSLTVLPFEDNEGEAAGNLLLWNCATVQPAFFVSESGEQGWVLITGEQDAALISWNEGALQGAVLGPIQQSFAGENWHRGVVVDVKGTRFAVGVSPAYIRDERGYDLTFDRYYPAEVLEARDDRTAAEILATMRQKQTDMSSKLDYLLGIIEVRPNQTLPSSVLEVMPVGPLSSNQAIIWKRILEMTEVVDGRIVPKPFRALDLGTDLNEAELQQALVLFERLGLIVSITLDGVSYLRRITEQDVVSV